MSTSASMMMSLLDIVLDRMTSSVIPGTPVGDQLVAVFQLLLPPDATQYLGAANDGLLAQSASTAASPASPRRRLLGRLLGRLLDRWVCAFPIRTKPHL